MVNKKVKRKLNGERGRQAWGEYSIDHFPGAETRGHVLGEGSRPADVAASSAGQRRRRTCRRRRRRRTDASTRHARFQQPYGARRNEETYECTLVASSLATNVGQIRIQQRIKQFHVGLLSQSLKINGTQRKKEEKIGSEQLLSRTTPPSSTSMRNALPATMRPWIRSR